MNGACGRLFVQIAAIILIPAAIGIAWNRRILMEAWSGRPVKSTPQAISAVPSAIPLPLGLLQVKDFFDHKDAVIVDARNADSYRAGHIKGALSLPREEAEAKLPQFQKKVHRNSTLVVYCNGFGCQDSMELGKRLITAGYLQVYVYDGGYPEWRDAGRPTEGGKP